jgi:DNA repair protein RecO (recombination protein O)
MKKIIKNKGIVIKVQDYLENAVIATILTENGKQSYLIKGAKKINSGTKRFAALLTVLEFNATESTGLSTLTEATIINNNTIIKDDLVRFNYASIILEKLNYFSDQVTDFKLLFEFTLNILNLIEKYDYFTAVTLIFEVKLLYLLGVAPSFNRCPNCGNKAINGALHVESGGFLCEKCHYLKEVTLSRDDSLIFKTIYVTKINQIDEEFLKSFDSNNNIIDCIDYYYEYHLDFKSKVKEIIKKIG